tara:strand:- start:987 stop:1586 length:600 start_codon:yes stop_codon:yes gene_type:complete
MAKKTPHSKKTAPKKPFGQRVKRGAIRTGVALGIGAAAIGGAGKAAEHFQDKVHDKLKPTVAKIAEYSKLTQEAAKKQVNGFVKDYGWEIFKRSLSGAVGAVTVASFLGGSRRKSSRRKDGELFSQESTTPAISGNVRSTLTAGGAIGGAAVPGIALSAGALRGTYRLWQSMSAEQRKRTISVANGIAKSGAGAVKKIK